MKKPLCPRQPAALACLRWLGAALLTCLFAGPASAELSAALRQQVQALAQQVGDGGRAARVEVEPGQLDPRLRLAPCQKIEPYLPSGSRAWGRTRVGLRCLEGSVAWNVYLPVTVRVWAPALVLREPLAAGTELSIEHLTEYEVDWAERQEPPLTDAGDLLGLSLARALPAGHAPRASDLRRREWFAAGERVRVSAVGAGFAVSTEGLALQRGIDGQTVRVRTEHGRVVSGRAVGERLVELTL